MNKAITIISLLSNICLLIFSYVAIDDINFRLSRWNNRWDENIFIIFLYIAPITSISLLYLAINENWLDYLKTTLQRRRIEGQRLILEEQKRISELNNS